MVDGRLTPLKLDRTSLHRYDFPIMASEWIQRQIDLLLDDIEDKVRPVPASCRYTG